MFNKPPATSSTCATRTNVSRGLGRPLQLNITRNVPAGHDRASRRALPVAFTHCAHRHNYNN